MKSWLLCVILASAMALGSPATSEWRPGEKLPELRGEYLSGRRAVLPQDASGRVALLLFGFSYDSRFQVESWTKRFRADFDKNSKATFYEIPMIGGVARLGKWFIDGGMRRGTPKADHEHVITVYGGTESWKERLDFRAQDDAYLVLLDPQGTVVWRYAGPVDDRNYRDLAAHVSQLISEQPGIPIG